MILFIEENEIDDKSIRMDFRTHKIIKHIATELNDSMKDTIKYIIDYISETGKYKEMIERFKKEQSIDKMEDEHETKEPSHEGSFNSSS